MCYSYTKSSVANLRCCTMPAPSTHLVVSRQEASAVHVAVAQPCAQLARLALPRQRQLPARAPARQHSRCLRAAPQQGSAHSTPAFPLPLAACLLKQHIHVGDDGCSPPCRCAYTTHRACTAHGQQHSYRLLWSRQALQAEVLRPALPVQRTQSECVTSRSGALPAPGPPRTRGAGRQTRPLFSAAPCPAAARTPRPGLALPSAPAASTAR